MTIVRGVLAVVLTRFAAAPAAEARITKVVRIGWLGRLPGLEVLRVVDAFRQGLRQLGYVEVTTSRSIPMGAGAVGTAAGSCRRAAPAQGGHHRRGE
jgi:hypothetical protein